MILRSKTNPNIYGTFVKRSVIKDEDSGEKVVVYYIRVAKGAKGYDEDQIIGLTAKEAEAVAGTGIPKGFRIVDVRDPEPNEEGYTLWKNGKRFTLWKLPQQSGKKQRWLIEDKANDNARVKTNMAFDTALALWEALEKRVRG